AAMTTSAAKKITPEIKAAARAFYLRHTPIAVIAEQFGVSGRTIYNWRDEGNWDDLIQGVSREQAISSRIVLLAEKDNKTPAELDEMDRLFNHLEKIARIDQIKSKTAAGNSNGSVASTKEKKKKNDTKNDISS